MSTGINVTIPQLQDSLRRLFKHNLASKRYRPTPFVWSPPGVGKSAIIRSLAEEIGYDMIDIRLATKSVLDLAGVPYKHTLEDGTVETRWARPDFARARGKYVLFLDELPSAVPTVQAAAYEIMLDRRVGGHVLPDDILIIAAGNRAEDRGVVYEMPVPLRNRLVHYNLVADVDSFIRYGMQVGLDERLLAFVKFNPKLLHQMPSGSENSFPTPRSWEFLSSLMGTNPEFHDIAGVIGEGAASELMAFLKVRDKLPDIQKVLETGQPWTTNELSLQYAFTFSLCTHFRRMFGEGNKKRRASLLDNFIDIVKAQSEEMMVLSFFLIKDDGDIIVDLFMNDKYKDGVVDKVASVLR